MPSNKNRGAFTTPFSGVGVEHAPFFPTKNANSFLLHEWGYLPDNKGWNFDAVFSPFWRLYYNEKPGHSISAGECLFHVGPKRLVLVPPQCLMRCEGRLPAPHFWIHFSYSRRLGGQKIKTGRYTYCTNDPYKADSPLLPSGLLGPVRLSTTK